jgi:transposase-like protein
MDSMHEMDLAGETEEARRATGVSPAAAAGLAPDPEVDAHPKRRRFTREYKLRILREADRCRQPGEIGALLRREGLYSSVLTAWRAARERGELGAKGAPSRGRPSDPDLALKVRNEELERENARLRTKLEQAEAIIEVQKKLSTLLDLK